MNEGRAAPNRTKPILHVTVVLIGLQDFSANYVDLWGAVRGMNRGTVEVWGFFRSMVCATLPHCGGSS